MFRRLWTLWPAWLLIVLLLAACGVDTERGVTLAAPASTLLPTALPPTVTPTRAPRATPIATPTLPTAALIDAATAPDLEEIATWRASLGPVLRLAISPDGQTLAASTLDGRVIMWDMADESDPRVLGEGPQQVGISITGASSTPWGALAFLPGGELLLAARPPGTITIWDVAAGEARADFSYAQANQIALGAVAFSPDGQFMVRGVPDLLEGAYEVWEVEAGQRISRREGHNGLLSVAAFSPDGRLLATSGTDHHLIVWDFANGEPLVDVETESRRPAQVAFDRTGEVVAVASTDGKLNAWRIEADSSGEGLALVDPNGFSQPDGFDGLAFSPAADLLALVQEDGSLRLWAVRRMVGGRLQLDDAGIVRPQPVPPMSGFHIVTWASLAFSPDGTRIATSGPGDTVHLWAIP